MGKPKACPFGRVWTAAEIAVVVRDYGTVPTVEIAKALGRSRMAVLMQASIRKLARQRHWTPAEDARLAHLWMMEELRVEGFYEKLGKELRRTPQAIHHRGRDLELPFGVPQGFESVAAAARRVGMSGHGFRSLVRSSASTGAKIPIYFLPKDPQGRKGRRKERKGYVSPDTVDQAVAWWTRETDTIHAAAHRFGLSVQMLSERVRLLGEKRARLRPGSPWRLPAELLERAAKLQSGADVALALGISDHRMARLCRRFGARRAKRQFFLTVEEGRALLARAQVEGRAKPRKREMVTTTEKKAA